LAQEAQSRAEELGLEVVAAADADVAGGAFCAGFHDQVVGGGKADANLAGLDDETPGAWVFDPAGLIWKEESAHGREDLGDLDLD
jgi:hypothetical protein